MLRALRECPSFPGVPRAIGHGWGTGLPIRKIACATASGESLPDGTGFCTSLPSAPVLGCSSPQLPLLGRILSNFADTQGDSMIEIATALIGGVFLLGGALITARWTRSRSGGSPTPAPLPPASNAQSNGGADDPQPPRNVQPDGGTTTAPQPPRNARSGGITVNGQFIETNNGTVSQNNYRDGKR